MFTYTVHLCVCVCMYIQYIYSTCLMPGAVLHAKNRIFSKSLILCTQWWFKVRFISKNSRKPPWWISFSLYKAPRSALLSFFPTHHTCNPLSIPFTTGRYKWTPEILPRMNITWGLTYISTFLLRTLSESLPCLAFSLSLPTSFALTSLLRDFLQQTLRHVFSSPDLLLVYLTLDELFLLFVTHWWFSYTQLFSVAIMNKIITSQGPL